MDGTEDDGRYPPNSYGVNHHKGYGYVSHRRLPVRSSSYSQPVENEYVEDDNDEDEEDEEQLAEEDDVDHRNNMYLSQKNVVPHNDEEGDKDRDGDGDENDGNSDDSDDDEDDKPTVYAMKVDDLEWHPKKRKLKSLISTYQFAPRVPTPSASAPSALKPSSGGKNSLTSKPSSRSRNSLTLKPSSKPSSGGRNSLSDWTEHDTFVLLDAWSDKFLQHGRKSLWSEEWQEVAEKVSDVSKVERTDTQCRNRLDTLKKKYKKEWIKVKKMGDGTSKWVYFNRMDKLMSTPPQSGLFCGLDSGEYVFMNPRVYLNRANGLDEMKDSPGNSDSGGEEGSVELQPKKRRCVRDSDEVSSFKLLADSIQKFSGIYEKIENNKRKQMLELEKMRMDFHKDLETHKRQILERMQSEISKLHQRGEDGENDDSGENGM